MENKSIKSVPIALIALVILPNAAYTQTSLTIYGIADAGIVHERGGAAGNVMKLGSGVQSGSRLGFRGMESISPSLSAMWMNNTVKFSAPTWRGLGGEIAYGFGEVPGDSAANRHIGASIGYVRGPLTVQLAHHDAENAFGTDDARSTLLVGRFDFGVAAASAGVGINKGLGVIDNRDYLLGLAVPVGTGSLLASFIRKDDRTGLNANADQWALGYAHSLSRRTNLYTSFARIRNDPGVGFTVGNATEAGTDNKAFNIGLRHKF